MTAISRRNCLSRGRHLPRRSVGRNGALGLAAGAQTKERTAEDDRDQKHARLSRRKTASPYAASGARNADCSRLTKDKAEPRCSGCVSSEIFDRAERRMPCRSGRRTDPRPEAPLSARGERLGQDAIPTEQNPWFASLVASLSRTEASWRCCGGLALVEAPMLNRRPRVTVRSGIARDN